MKSFVIKNMTYSQVKGHLATDNKLFVIIIVCSDMLRRYKLVPHWMSIRSFYCNKVGSNFSIELKVGSKVEGRPNLMEEFSET